MDPLSRWLVRAGAVLVAVSPLLAQCDLGGRSVRPASLLGPSAPPLEPLAFLLLALWLHAPLPLGLLLLLGVRRSGTGGGPALRALTLISLLLLSFFLATVGSLLLTQSGGMVLVAAPSFAVSLLLFLLPLGLGGIALARAVGGNFAGSSGGYGRLALALLLALDGFFLADGGWTMALSWTGPPPQARMLGAIWLLPVGGLLAAASELLARVRPRPAPAPQPGAP